MSASRTQRVGVLLAVAGVLALAAFWLPPLVQPLEFHAFADTRSLLGIPNFGDVASNLPFLLVGVAGLAFVLGERGRAAFRDPRERWPYATAFLGVTLVAFGSAFYHLAPDNARLVWDRLPITVAFMSLVAALVAERISLAAGLRLLAPLVVLGLASVAWWDLSSAWGAENLRPYVHLQIGAIALVLLIAMLFPSPYTRGNDVYLMVAWYGVAKLTEVLDREILSAGEIVSGHSLKHLLAAAAVFVLLRMLQRRARR